MIIPVPLALLLCGLLVPCAGFAGQEKGRDTGLSAQTGRPGEGVSFTCLLWDDAFEQQLFYRDGEALIALTLSTEMRSPVYRLQRSGEFALFWKHGPGAQHKESSLVPAGRCAIPEGTGELLFVLFPEGDDELPTIRILPMDDSRQAFPAGTFRFVNCSEQSLTVQVAGQEGALAPRGMRVMESGVSLQGGTVPCVVSDEEGACIFETRLIARANGREIVFISSPDAEEELPGVRFLSQLLPRQLPGNKGGSSR